MAIANAEMAMQVPASKEFDRSIGISWLRPGQWGNRTLGRILARQRDVDRESS
jgi:hypothetical protein